LPFRKTKATAENKALIRSTVSMYLLQAAKYIFPFITLPYLARVLGTDGFAVRSYVLSVMTFVQMAADFGFMNYAIASIVKDGLCSETTSRVSSRIMAARLVLFVPLVLVVFAINATVPLMGENASYVWVAFAGVFFNSLLPDFVFRAYERMGIITVRYVVSKGVAVVLTFLLIHSIDDLLLVPALDLLSSLIAFVWSWVAAVREFGVRPVSFTVREVWHDLTQAAVYFVSGVSTIVFSSLTTFLLGVFNHNPAEIAYWGIAMTVMNGFSSLYSPLSQSLYPNYLKRAKGNSSFSLRRLYLLCLPVLLVAAVMFFLLSEPVMWLLGGGDEYLDGSYVLAILSPIVFFSFYVQLSGWPSLGAVGKVRELTTTTVWGTLFHLLELVLLALFTHYELWLVAIARVLSEGVMAVLRIIECRRAGII
jgi:PST family polysaccharide transporter